MIGWMVGGLIIVVVGTTSQWMVWRHGYARGRDAGYLEGREIGIKLGRLREQEEAHAEDH